MLGAKIIRFPVLPSTNAYLKEHFSALPHGTVVTCDRQTAGKGRFERAWHSDRDLLMSVLIKENLRLSEIPQLGLISAAAVFETLKKHVPDPLIKWPNDIIVGGKKVAGILLESIIGAKRLNCLVIGIGINVNTAAYPESLAKKATSLKLATGAERDIEELRLELIGNLDAFYREFKLGGRRHADICAENSCLIGKEVIFNDFKTSQKGKVLAILENGNIVIETAGVTAEYNYGEITFLDI
ncbi:MAG: biotin--[acetyl-CoA-carboxylase] ligase [Bacillota bacterium]|jgi:BirA family biotin operon repressor/biotin-[acetyl-CoA-carboxylase] ligase|nr:biotin--[acetyl-CoA-carboxylase] ligase [Bacillota bacterium]NLM31233.1 biotin--[acetyl-CoA-carboxylase] ligase [Acholeplasmataceae bacterium]